MCGIAGILSTQPAPVRDAANSFLRILYHRGPDDRGWLTQTGNRVREGRGAVTEDAAEVLFVHRRLSIIDLSMTGWQPMRSCDGRFYLIFNGEIYNYVELRKELESLGHRFRSTSDSEVLLQAYCQWGRRALSRFVGMFSFAILDSVYRMVFLARDFFGIKPLYYTRWPNGLAFASEIKALLALPQVQSRAHPQCLYDYLRFGLTDHRPETLFENIYHLPAAHCLQVDLDDVSAARPERYWQIDRRPSINLSTQQSSERIRELFLDNVKLHLRSDVAVGAALSGGIDSSAIVTSMRRVEPNLRLHAFSYVAEEESLSEERWIDTAGRAAGAQIHKTVPDPHQIINDLDQLIYQQDEPFGSTSIYAQHRVFRLARESGVTVMLDGQGADEIFAGYRWYLSARLASLLRQGAWPYAWSFLQHASHQPGAGGINSLLLHTGSLLAPSLRKWALGIAGRELMPAWLNVDWFESRGVRPKKPHRDCTPHVLRDQLHQTLVESSLPRLLRYEDRNSMAFSIESRVPFLTPALVEFALQLPEESLIDRRGVSKSIFRSAMRGIVPDAILDRTDKIGFETPEKKWLTTLRPWVSKVLHSDVTQEIAAFHHKNLFREWRQVDANQRPFDFRLWRWINLIRWADVFNVRF